LQAHPTTLIFLAFDEDDPVGAAVCFIGFSTFDLRGDNGQRPEPSSSTESLTRATRTPDQMIVEFMHHKPLTIDASITPTFYSSCKFHAS
jgi:hypothetical protein